jgi:signal transduction histidine kinase
VPPGYGAVSGEFREVPERWIRPTCVVLLVAAWALDLLTPQLFVAAILLNVPIALSSLALDFRFTQVLVVLALFADVSAGYENGAVAGHHWDALAVSNRLISAFSFLLVGLLAIATQRSAARAGELSARQERAARERSARRAVEVIRGSVNPELIARAIAREAPVSLAVDRALLYVFRPQLDEPTTYAAQLGSGDVDVTLRRPESPVLSLLHRMIEGGERLTRVSETDALGRLVLDTLGAPHAIAASLIEHETTFGVLVLLRASAPFEDHFEEGLTYFVDQSAIALAQAALFVQLAARNDELGAANVALRERGDIIRDIVYALSHDLRTPLSAANMTMRQAFDGAYGPLPPAYRTILERTIESNDALQRLAETLLLVSRYESGEASRRREPVDLERLARDVVTELEPLWRAKHVAVALEARDAPAALGDERELRRALVNLLANAVAWTPPGRRIEVRVGADARGARVSVEDEGYGVPEHERARLFERVREGPSRQGAGSGLGLYLVRRIAEGHGGNVSYAPRPGGGSAFTLTLPLAAAAVPT